MHYLNNLRAFKSKPHSMTKNIIAFLFATISSLPNAAPFFTDDFEGPNGITSGPSPLWSWKSPYASNNRFGMMFGEHDIYSTSAIQAHSGRRSLRINFNGRNNFCNTCGLEAVTVTSQNLASGCFNTSGVRETTIFNRDNGFSVWDVTSSNDTQVCVNLETPKLAPIIDIAASITVGDELRVPRVCGLNGSIGGQTRRRSDCDLAINYLNGIEKSHFDYGNTLSRRMYIYIPSETIIPSVTIKLGYAKFDASSIVPFVSSSRGARFEVDGNAILGFIQTELFFERDRWMYIEEVYTRETAANANNGRFQLFAGFSGDDVTQPIHSATGLHFGELKSLSIIGNWPHFNDASGYMYVDDVSVSNQYIGPVSGDVVLKPMPPHNFDVRVIEQ